MAVIGPKTRQVRKVLQGFDKHRVNYRTLNRLGCCSRATHRVTLPIEGISLIEKVIPRTGGLMSALFLSKQGVKFSCHS